MSTLLHIIICLTLLIATTSFSSTMVDASNGGGIQTIEFAQNTKVMYEQMLSKTPWFVRDNARKTMDAAIIDVCNGGRVTEQDMYEIVKRTTPKLFIQKSFDIIEQYKTSV